MVVDPDDTHGKKGGDVGDELRPLAENSGEKPSRSNLGNGELEHQESDSNCEYAVGKRYDARRVHEFTSPPCGEVGGALSGPAGWGEGNS